MEPRRLFAGAGDPNLAFGNGTGQFSFSPAGEPDYVEKVIVQSDGKILDIGHTHDGYGMVLRLNADGTKDTSFGTGGTAVFKFPMPDWATGPEESFAYSAVVQVNGNITVVGTAISHMGPSAGSNIWGVSTIRLTSAGTVDPTFKSFHNGFYNGLEMTGEDIVVQNGTDRDVSNDRVVVIGSEHHTTLTDNDDMFAVRLLADGTIDRTFYNNSDIQPGDYVGFGGNDYAEAAVVENDGSSRNGDIILVGRSVDDSGNSKFAIARLRASDGKPDTTFSGDGKVLSAFVSEAKYNDAQAVVVQADGSIVVAGAYSTTQKNGTDTHLGVFRLKPDGSGDSTFGTGNGQITLDANPAGIGMAASQSGDLLIDTLATDHVSITALTSAGKIDSVFSADGKQSGLGVRREYNTASIATTPGGTFVVAAGQGFCTSSFYDRAKVTVYINSSDSTGAEAGPNTMSFYVHQFEAQATGTKIYFQTSGTAGAPTTIPRTNADYSGISTSILEQYVTVPAGSNLVTTTLTPINDTRPEADETATFTLIPKPGVYDIGGPSTVTLTILDNDGQRIAGQVYNDANGNRKPDEAKYLAGVTVYLDANNNAKLDSGERTVTTDASGKYVFYAAPLGKNIVRQVVPSGYTQDDPLNSAGITVTVATGQNYTLAAFGDKPISGGGGGGGNTASITGFTFNNSNKNGKYDTGDSLAGGKTVWIDLDDDGVIDTNETKLTTATDGSFTFTGLAAGTYHVRRVFPSGYTESTPARYITLTAGQASSGVAIGSKTA